MQESERVEKILKVENEEERQKRAPVERTDRLESKILFRRNENNNVCIRILRGGRIGP